MTVWSTFGRRWVQLQNATAAYAFFSSIISALIREKLTANRTYYVRTDGSDSNTGLADTAGGAFLTIQKAIDTVAALDISIYNVTISVADGTYTGGAAVSGAWLGSGNVTLQGNTTTPANCIISTTSANCITVSNFGRLLALGFKVQTTTSGIGCAATNGGVLTITGLMEYGACAAIAQVYAERYGAVVIIANYTISGNSPYHFQALSHAYILNAATTTTLTGTPAFTAFVRAERMGLAESVAAFSGAATGARYSAITAGGVNSFGAGASYFPGSAGGTATAPGWYA
jgi:hypothetical protein